ncbi:hypothetical protein HKCCSP123_03190 [Rhodobacterales bacterium HKCCSP123]|nr:hypothetical protein [Rhodobacterales bacterium HKCCSP123]
MSDPAKSADEIEDVLASIRRLVSESGPVGAQGAGPSAPGKLVLTPALRVSDPDDPWAPVPPASQAPADSVADDAADAVADETATAAEDPTWGLEDRLSDWGEIEDSAEESIADAIAETGYPDAPRYDMAARAEDVSAAEDVSEPEDVSEAEDAFELSDLAMLDGVIAEDLPSDAFEPETGDADWPDRGADSALRDLAAARFGQVVATGSSEADPAPTGSSEPPAGTDAAVDPSSSGPEASAEAAATMPPAEADTPPPAEDAMTEPEAEDTREAIRSQPGFTPIFSRRMDTATPQEEETRAADRADEDIEDLGEATSPFTFPDADEGVLDEETLREIVAEVVREELQGALGQRITRNVRKMVRREIRIALAAEDLE